jgi:hypothetical protein
VGKGRLEKLECTLKWMFVYEGLEQIEWVENRIYFLCDDDDESTGSIKSRGFLDQLSNYELRQCRTSGG